MESRYLQTIAHSLVLIAILLGLIAVALWVRVDSVEPRAQAQVGRPASGTAEGTGIPDAGRQRQMSVEQLELVNKHLADIERGLQQGAYVIQTTEAKEAPKPPR
jgi:hypothetical protein